MLRYLPVRRIHARQVLDSGEILRLRLKLQQEKGLLESMDIQQEP